MKQAKRRYRYPALEMPLEVQSIVDTEIESQGYSTHAPAMAAWSAWLKRSIAFERKQATGR
jgi:hypothetical protein